MKEIILAIIALLAVGLAITITINKRKSKIKNINKQSSEGDNSPNSNITNIK